MPPAPHHARKPSRNAPQHGRQDPSGSAEHTRQPSSQHNRNPSSTVPRHNRQPSYARASESQNSNPLLSTSRAHTRNPSSTSFKTNPFSGIPDAPAPWEAPHPVALDAFTPDAILGELVRGDILCFSSRSEVWVASSFEGKNGVWVAKPGWSHNGEPGTLTLSGTRVFYTPFDSRPRRKVFLDPAMPNEVKLRELLKRNGEQPQVLVNPSTMIIRQDYFGGKCPWKDVCDGSFIDPNENVEVQDLFPDFLALKFGLMITCPVCYGKDIADADMDIVKRLANIDEEEYKQWFEVHCGVESGDLRGWSWECDSTSLRGSAWDSDSEMDFHRKSEEYKKIWIKRGKWINQAREGLGMPVKEWLAGMNPYLIENNVRLA